MRLLRQDACRSFLPEALLLILLTVSATGRASAQERDHPLLPAITGYEIQLYDSQEVGAHAFTLPDGQSRQAEGRYTRIDYILSEGAKGVSAPDIARRCAEALATRGGKKVFDEMTAEGGTLTMSVPMSGASVWVQVEIVPGGESYIVTVVEEGQTEAPADSSAISEISPLALARLLQEKGVVTLSSITFDGGTATLSADSEMTLLSVIQALQVEPSLKLEVRGHTDAAASAVGNLKLSKDRAMAIRKYLLDKGGIDGGRVQATGMGDKRPVGDKGSSENSRVELVQKK
jgi:outer membrane protein OmpA-like peptidoglycan-associated protein